MARGSFGRRHGGYQPRASGPRVDSAGAERDWAPIVDKNPFYRTIDIVNGVTHKHFRLVELQKKDGHPNCTDGTTIYLNLGESLEQPILERLDDIGDRKVYRLACLHLKEMTREHDPGYVVNCYRCGEHEAYIVLHHEFSHPLAGSFDAVWRAFEDAMVEDYRKLAPQIPEDEFGEFLHLVCNAFDDDRCNGWMEHVWPGVAADLWARWKRIVAERGIEATGEDFIAYCLALGVDEPVDPSSRFAPFRDVIEWGMKRIRGVGPARGMAIIRVVLDRCIGAILAGYQPPPPAQPAPSAPAQGGNQGIAVPATPGGQSAPVPPPPGSQGAAVPAPPGSQPSSQPPAPLPAPPSNVPSAAALKPSPGALAGAVQKLMQGASSHDPKTQHPRPSADDVANDPRARQIQALLAQAFGQDLQNLQPLAAPGQPLDPDMAQSAQQLRDGMAARSEDSQLSLDARANILFLDVKDHHIFPHRHVTLDRDERAIINDLRAIFFKILGRQKMARAAEGQELDLQATIQFLIETGIDDDQPPVGAANTTDIFRKLRPYQGFAYLILIDMSGSMEETFPSLERAARMLHEGLDFPFVQGEVWGFRGSEKVEGRDRLTDTDILADGEVWLYRYDRLCRGYVGQVVQTQWNKTLVFPVTCNGITPMNSAIRVAVRHLLTQVPAGMAKQLFVLTDGSPLQVKQNGRDLPEWLLRQWVQKAVDMGRQNGIHVQALVIGDGVTDDEAKKMFGPPRFWSRAPASRSYGEHGSTVRQITEPEGLFRGEFFRLPFFDHHDQLRLRVLNGANLGVYEIDKILDDDRVVLNQPLVPENDLRYYVTPGSEDVGQVLFRLVRQNFSRYLMLHT